MYPNVRSRPKGCLQRLSRDFTLKLPHYWIFITQCLPIYLMILPPLNLYYLIFAYLFNNFAKKNASWENKFSVLRCQISRTCVVVFLLLSFLWRRNTVTLRPCVVHMIYRTDTNAIVFRIITVYLEIDEYERFSDATVLSKT